MAPLLKSKLVLHGSESRAKILKGADLLADAVKVTLGPKGRNVVIGRRIFGLDPAVTKDGVTVANTVNPTDPCEQIGADLLRAAAQKTVDNAGDGTTTSVVLAQAMLHAGFKALESGESPIALKRSMDRDCEAVVEAIRNMSTPCTGDMIYQVANISSNGDEALARIVAEAIAKVGKDGVMTVEESRTLTTHLEVVNGLQLQSGYLSAYFMTDPQTMKCEFDDALIFLWEGKLSSAKSLIPVCAHAMRESRPLLIIGGDFEAEAISTLAINRIKKGLQVCAITTGAFGERRREILRDVAAISGAFAFTEDCGAKLESVEAKHFGTARKIIADQNKTIITTEQNPEATSGRISEIRRQIETAEGVEKAHLQVRLSGLTGGVAIVKVGAATEVEMREKKDRAEDAMYAVKAAAEEGVVEGGGMALLRARTAASDGGLVFGACSAPARQIARNAGLNVKDLVPLNPLHGYNVASHRFEDLRAAGVIDPAKVVIEALKNAVSVAGMILTTEAMVAEVIDDDGR